MKNKLARSLETLARIKQLEMVDKQRALAEMQAQLQSLNRRVKDIIESRAHEIECARQDPTSRVELQNYLDGLQKREKALKTQIFHLADFMIPVQESVRDSFRDIKALEITSQTIQNRIREDKDKQEQKFLDEISIQAQVRKHD